MDPKTRRGEHPIAQGGERERENERRHSWERESPLAPIFIWFFLPPVPVLCKLGLGWSAVLPEVLTVLGPSFDLPLFYFFGLFPSCLLATAVLDSFPSSDYLTLLSHTFCFLDFSLF